MKRIICIITIIATTGVGFAKVDLATLPPSDSTQITIYNSADLTLVRDSRSMTLKEGLNKLQFSWANTLIDPTSLEMFPKANGRDIYISQVVYPPRVKNLALWNFRSDFAGKVPMEITYLTSGLTWRAFYMGTLSKDESTMYLQGYVRVTNNSGEDYENAQTRLIVGKVNLTERIADLARRQHPYGSPIQVYSRSTSRRSGMVKKEAMLELAEFESVSFDAPAPPKKPKEVKKEGLSEYFLYTIEGTETIPNGWSKRLPSFDTDGIPVVNLYKYEENRYGRNVIRFLSFKNDEEHELGDTPIPGGAMKVYRTVDNAGHLSYEGQSSFKYIPIDEDVELNLGPVGNVVVEPVLMKYETENYRFNDDRNIIGYDEIRWFKIDIRNTRDIPIKIEIMRNYRTQYWDLQNSGDYGEYEKYDKDTSKYTLILEPQSKKQFGYILRTYHGTRQESWNK